MKKTILTYGGIAGAIVTAMMVYSTYSCYSDTEFKPNAVFGYTGMLVAFIFVFLGIRNFRNNHNNGLITFGKAFKIGCLIALIASSCYVLAWLIEYYCFFPDFMDKYAATMLSQAKASGMSAAELQSKTQELNKYREWYKNPALVILMTYAEILPLGLVISLISALILKRKEVKA